MRENPPGRVGDPLTDEELREKFEMCAVRSIGEEATDAAYSRIADLREQNPSDIDALFDALTTN
jgi:hypothetical protein